jgi:hypothetical protein
VRTIHFLGTLELDGLGPGFGVLCMGSYVGYLQRPHLLKKIESSRGICVIGVNRVFLASESKRTDEAKWSTVETYD